MKIVIYISVLLLSASLNLQAQQLNQFNVNIYNGLPSNNVYYLKKDKFGYLWIATDNGVVKYNGYTFKKFGLAEGLPNADVWSLQEDKQGRMWLLSIANDIGYIFNNNFHKAYTDSSESQIYPVSFVALDSGIAFLSVNRLKGDMMTLYTEKKDTLKLKDIEDFGHQESNYLLGEDGSIYRFKASKFYKKNINGDSVPVSRSVREDFLKILDNPLRHNGV